MNVGSHNPHTQEVANVKELYLGAAHTVKQLTSSRVVIISMALIANPVAGMDDYMFKPVSPQFRAALLGKWLPTAISGLTRTAPARPGETMAVSAPESAVPVFVRAGMMARLMVTRIWHAFDSNSSR